MLAIRMQRTGRKGHPMYRVIVQDSHRQPTSGRVVANLGSYNPHTKENTLNKEEVSKFLKNGAQPSDRVVKLLQTEKVELPDWVKVTSVKKQKTIKNTEKLRRNQPKSEVIEEPAEVAVEPVAEEAAAETAPEEVVAETPAEVTAEETPVESTAEAEASVEKPAVAKEDKAESEEAKS